MLAGDEDTLNQLGEEYAVYLEFAYEIIDELQDELATMSDYEAGRLIGRVVGEIGLAIGTGAAGVAVKSATVAGVATKLKGSSLVMKYGDEMVEAFERVPVRATAIATSGMCFVAGTPVLTPNELAPIEEIQRGDLVLARDPKTGTQLYKRVVNTITTHPSELYEVRYGIDADGDGAADSTTTIVTTAEHPFYVEELGAFVPAAELTIADVLALAEARTDNGLELVLGCSRGRAVDSHDRSPSGSMIRLTAMEISASRFGTGLN